MIINITCGQIANDYYSSKYKDEIFIPFNEAMNKGNPKEEIFSDEFILERLHTHNTTMDEYISKMNGILLLKDKINNYEITCWFGNDDFCKMNFLTFLAYLDQINYQKEVVFHLIDEENYNIIDTEELSVVGYNKKYLAQINTK